MSSHYVHALREGDRLNVFHDSADGFHLQEDVTKPMIFVSAGTGFAPMRAFLWERLALKHAGSRWRRRRCSTASARSSLDYIYRDEIERFAAEGVLDHVHVATSREQPGSREYVQDRIRAQGALMSGACSPPAATSTSAARSRCATPSAPPSSTSSPNMGRCRAAAEAYLHELEADGTTAPTSGAEPGPAGSAQRG